MLLRGRLGQQTRGEPFSRSGERLAGRGGRSPEFTMPFYQKPLVIIVASLVFPPAGLVLLWIRGRTGILKKLLLSLPILGLAVAHLFLVYGLRLELYGGMTPSLAFERAGSHDRAIEASRAAQQQPAPEATAESSVPAAPQPPSAPSAAPQPSGSTYWADFRGPDRLGHYDQAPILTSWPERGLERLWKEPCGGGYASFTVARGVAFTIEQRRGNEVVAAYDLLTGRERWTNAWSALFHEVLGGDGPRATPVWDDGRVYALGATGELRCMNASDGKTIWRRNILSDNNAVNLQWGMAGSPLVVGNALIVQPGGTNGHSVAAYDKRTGERLWSALDDKAAYVSAVSATVAGIPQLLTVTATRVVGLSPADGKLLWEYPWAAYNGISAVEPLVVAPNRVFFSSGYDQGAAVVELSSKGDILQADRVWANRKMKAKFNGPVLYEGFLYGLDDGILACVDPATGELKWKGGRYGYGQLLLASGHLVIVTEEGELVLVRATPEKLDERARFQALSGKTWNYPAISDGVLLVRNEREIAAFRIGGR
jgi:outer membrane protein assembly factor BamB